MSNVRELLIERGIRLNAYRAGSDVKTLCPQCSHTRKKKTDPCLSVTIDPDDNGAVFRCHNCSWSGNVNTKARKTDYVPRKSAPIKVSHTPSPRGDKVDEYFAKRGISREVLDRNHVGYEQQWMPGCENGATVGVITFPYYRGGEVVNVKYRSGTKQFRQIKNAEKIYFGLDDLGKPDDNGVFNYDIIIVEGEIDKLSLEMAGFRNVVSVPDGAPQLVKDDVPDPEEDTKFSYVWNTRDYFKNAEKIILAVDSDVQGQALAEELARRYGKAKCWKVRWPTLNDVECKDANDTLTAHGPDVLRECIEMAMPYPLKSLHDVDAFDPGNIRLFRSEVEKVYSTGWIDVDEYFKIRPGEFSVVTGFPGSGKSQFIDALLVNLANLHGWRFAFCSFETPPARHMATLAELHLGKPFWPNTANRMTEGELRDSHKWMKNHFYFITAEDEIPTIDWILETAQQAVLRYGIKGLVIDPYNEIESKRPAGMTETEWVSLVIAKVKRFAQAHGVHVWFIAHPSKPMKKKDGTTADVTLYDISGSSHWNNKADVGIVVNRDVGETHIDVRKVRFKEVGHIGEVRLNYDVNTGRFAQKRAQWGYDQ
jgi:twinkle protein